MPKRHHTSGTTGRSHPPGVRHPRGHAAAAHGGVGGGAERGWI